MSGAISKVISLDEYDAGLLNDFGGGNVSWWHRYIRAELERAYEHYQSQIEALQAMQGDAVNGGCQQTRDHVNAQYTKIQDFVIGHGLYKGQSADKSHADIVIALAVEALQAMRGEADTKTHVSLCQEGYVPVPRAAVTEVLRISDRQHPAWDAVKAALLSAGKENDNAV